jgi:DNA-binding transcriptional ArsR family regulator
MSPLLRTETDEIRSIISFRTSSIYEMMLSLGALHSPTPRQERWAEHLRMDLPAALLEEVDFLYSRFENGVLLLELAVDYPDHPDVVGFLSYLEQMSIPRFLFYALGRLAPPEEMAKLEPDEDSLLSIIPLSFGEDYPETEARLRRGGFVDLIADPEGYRSRMIRIWKSYYEEYFAQAIVTFADSWEESVREKSRALSNEDSLEFLRKLTGHAELPEQIPEGQATERILLVPSCFARRQLMFYGYGGITIIYDCQLTEQRRAHLEMLEEDIAVVGKALTDRTRLQLLRQIAQDPELYGRQLSKLCGVSQPSVSRHLGILKDAGLIEERPAGSHITYQVVRQRIEQLSPHLLAYLYDEDVTGDSQG